MRSKVVAAVMLTGIIALTAWNVFYLHNNLGEFQLPFIPVNHFTHSPTAFYQGTEQTIVPPEEDLGFALFQLIVKDSIGRNIIISPLGISSSLSMTYNATETDTKSNMAKSLQFDKLSLQQINQASADLLHIVENSPSVDLNVASSIWTKSDTKLDPYFGKTAAKYYAGQVDDIDFMSPDSAQKINDWVSQETNNNIPSIVTPPLPKDLNLLLVNADYLKGYWTHPFDPINTKPQEFTLTNGTTTQVEMMHQKNNFPYYQTNDFQAVSLSYGKTEDISFYIFLPNKSLDLFLKKLTPDNWNIWMKAFKLKQGSINMPKFKVVYAADLKTPLYNIGMTKAFDSNQADFNSLGKAAYINHVLHKSYLIIDEGNTSTSTPFEQQIASTTSAEITNGEFNLNINRPFFFAIRDNHSGAILFMGVIANPHS